ncbi:amidohydrolase [Abyssalbus ytuae]|uniref:Amidohydrolase n=1 Tax=Abyssalbus ytuae TaxID=2926907 RepID=A0A9E7CTP1_9FLAO|nr:amidohydrolase [Abyssalbus ytuae]UOB16527.1 amidohydrolase [Abyssalbus ytuae]
MRKLLLIPLLLFLSCNKKEKVDLVVTNANIYTVDEAFSKASAFAVKNGKFIQVGTNEDILSKYHSAKILDAGERTVLPGFIDAHCHFYGLGLNMQQADLTGTKSFDEVIGRIIDFQKEKNNSFILGRGWDQNDWPEKEFPSKEKLDELFPATPVVLQRIDGHAYLVNQKVLDLAKITIDTKVEGGEIVVENGRLTGVLVDNPMSLIDDIIPQIDKQTKINALVDAEKLCFNYGLTTVNDAGLNREIIELIDSLHKTDELDMRVYAMISANKKDIDHYLKSGIYKTDKLNVRSVKVYADGALGSRGAALRKPYSDHPGHYGALVTPIETMKDIAAALAKTEFQMNTHAIGDSANHVVLNIYKDKLQGLKDKRWKIEHAQIVSPADFKFFDNIIPSVQPTHATSDMYWAEQRVGPDRIKSGYAYKQLLNINGKIALGTDFPVEQVNPFLTFYAAVARKDVNNYPENGFQIENALTREETLKGMTIWAAYSNFEENEKGSIEPGKFADFIILGKDIMQIPVNEIPALEVEEAYVGGKRVK